MTRSLPKPDVTIIGAGPAGCVAAIVLARRGWDVTLVEQHRFPRDKVCGECLSALGVETLARLDFLDYLRRHRPVMLTRARLVARDGTAAQIELPRAMWGITRRALDQELLDQARRAGADVRQPARCEKLRSDPPRLNVRDLHTNVVESLSPSYIFLADGKAASMPAGDMGVKAHFLNVDEAGDTISLFALAGHYVGIAPVEGGRWNIAMSVPAAKLKSFGGDLDALWDRALMENNGLARQVRRASRIGNWLASPLPRFGVRKWPRRIIPLGNAAAALEPIGGEGMGLAMCSAHLAAEALADAAAAHQELDASQLHRQYRRLWTRRRLACRAAALALSSRTLSKTFVSLINANRVLANLGLRLIGKDFVLSPRPR